MFYTGEEIGFSVLASVPETKHAYPLLGRPQDSLDGDDHTSVSTIHPLDVSLIDILATTSPILSTKARNMMPR